MKEERLAARLRRFEGLDLDGGHPALDLANTVDWRGTEKEYDWLAEPVDLAAWGQRAGLLSAEQAVELARELDTDPEAAARRLDAVRRLREALFGLFRALSRREVPPAADLRMFNDYLRRALIAGSLLAPGAGEPGAYRLAFAEPPDPADRFLVDLIRRAAELLTTVDPARLKACSSDDCGWLFIDTSRNGSRRWCSMAGCGNRAKAKRFYRQRKGAPSSEAGS